jgi:hypothetical protein
MLLPGGCAIEMVALVADALDEEVAEDELGVEDALEAVGVAAGANVENPAATSTEDK